MKRNQMVDNIYSSLTFFYSNKDYPEKLQRQIADYILDHIEDAGMLPPGYMKPIPFESNGKQYPLIPGDFKNEKDEWCTPGIHEWEPEE